MRTRRAEIGVNYEHVDITSDIKDSVTLMSYVDVASGESDSLSLTIQDRERKWMGGWMPQKGDHISAEMRFYDWESEGSHWGIRCGDFQVDEIKISGLPASCSIGAVSIPRSEAFNEEERTKNWEDVTVREIAAEIAGRAGLALYYEAEEIPVKSMEQDKQTDCKFLYSVCEKYGLAMKVFAEKIIIFSEAVYEAAAPATTLRYEDFSQYTYNSSLEGTYTGAKMSYTDPGTGEDHIVTVGGGDRIMEINEEADSAADAQRKAVAELNNANKKAVTFSGTIMARKEMLASCCIAITGFGKPDGIYYLDKVTTKVGRSGASQQTFEAHQVGNRMDGANVVLDPQEEPGETGEGTEYTVVKGDTLWTIAEQFLGTPLRYAEIYDLNKDVIEAEAQKRGKKDSSNGHWIFPGTVLQIPAAEGDEENGEQRDPDRQGVVGQLRDRYGTGHIPG